MNTLLPNGRIRIISILWLILFSALESFLLYRDSPAGLHRCICITDRPTGKPMGICRYSEAGRHSRTTIPPPTETALPPTGDSPFRETMEMVQDAYLPVCGPGPRQDVPPPVEENIFSWIFPNSTCTSTKVMFSCIVLSPPPASTMPHGWAFPVQSKIPNAYGSTWNIWMPDWLGIYWAGSLENGIHALPILPNGATLWEGYLGRPISYGCVVLGTYDAQLLYNWAEIGTTVEIQW